MGEEKAKSPTSQAERLKRAAEARNFVSTFAGKVPVSQDEARDLVARAVGEMTLQPESLKRFRRLLRDNKSTVAIEAWKLAKDFLEGRKDVGPTKPTQIIFNNHVARAPKDISGTGAETTAVETVAVEVRS